MAPALTFYSSSLLGIDLLFVLLFGILERLNCHYSGLKQPFQFTLMGHGLLFIMTSPLEAHAWRDMTLFPFNEYVFSLLHA